MSPLIDIIIPTFNSPDYLFACVQSIMDAPAAVGLRRVLIVNNGFPESLQSFPKRPDVEILQMEKNLGWEGGLQKGLEASKAPYVVFMNDDTFVPQSNGYWLNKMLRHFKHPEVGAVGPSSNVVMGHQNIFYSGSPEILRSSFLIGFCMMLSRKALDEAGGIDVNAPYHGDDIDISIRLRKAGYELLIDRTVFVYHHGFKTGQREFGSYWNSGEMQEKTAHHLIRKHSLRTWRDTLFGQVIPSRHEDQATDSEGNIVRKYVSGKTLEIGCGAQKTVPDAVGVDCVPAEGLIKSTGVVSVADVVSDVKDPLPFAFQMFDTVVARHILEHLGDTLEVLDNWQKVLKPGGRLIIAVPDESKAPTIPMNIEHQHSFTQASLSRLAKAVGLREVAMEDAQNGISFVGVFERN